MTRGPFPRLVPTTLPSASIRSSSTRGRSSSATTARTWSSRPAIPGVAQSRFSNSRFPVSATLPPDHRLRRPSGTGLTMDAKSHCSGGANLRTRSPGPDEYLHEWAANLVPSADDSLLGLDLSQSCQAPNCIGAFSVASRVTPETLFQIGSLTRTYIGIAIWRLIVEGALSLDAPVRIHLPDQTLMDDAVAAEVTVANLLDYSAGWYGDEG